MGIDILLLLVGMTVVVVGADKMVVSVGSLAAHWGISPIVVGAVIIGFGSSMPEMLVSVLALDQPNGLDLAIGNILGSNIANISLVLGAAVLVFPFSGQNGVLRREGSVMFGALILLSIFLWDLELSVVEGGVLVGALVLAGLVVVRWAAESPTSRVEEPEVTARPGRDLLIAVVGLVGLVAGARAMVVGAEGLAIEFGLSEGVVGLTILALGTSLPELGAVVASARRGRNDLVLGNILGSNIFNALGVAGVSGIFGAGVLTTGFRPDLVVMVAVAALAGVVAWTGDRLRRVEGVLLLVAYPVAVILAL